MAANVTKRLWEMSDMVDVLEAWEAANFSLTSAMLAMSKTMARLGMIPD
jgi:hypothetical protein